MPLRPTLWTSTISSMQSAREQVRGLEGVTPRRRLGVEHDHGLDAELVLDQRPLAQALHGLEQTALLAHDLELEFNAAS